jgi:hypothetical protein
MRLAFGAIACLSMAILLWVAVWVEEQRQLLR